MPASTAWTVVFAAALVASLVLRAWLASRQIRHVLAHRDAVPGAFASRVSLDAHRKAADYTAARVQLGSWQAAWGAALLVGWTLLGGLTALDGATIALVPAGAGEVVRQLVLVGAFLAIGGLLELPFSLWETFRLEARFGFNRMTWKLWLADAAKGIALTVLIGAPLFALVLWMMATAGAWWWLAAWIAWLAVVALAQLVYPTLIAPLFNRFEPLRDESLRDRIEALMRRAGFKAKGLFVMDGSLRSAHGNAYFTGFGRARRVVFFDTLLSRLEPAEIEAVLAHELGHFKLKHVARRLALAAVFALGFFALLGWLSGQLWFFTGLGIVPRPERSSDALALLAMLLVTPVFSTFATPLFARRSRRDEFEADAYAAGEADRAALASALVKLHEDNASTLTPDPVYARFYYSHPPAAERVAALAAA